MNLNFLLLYITLSITNVVLQTVKSLCTIRCKTFTAACMNAIAYGLYTYVIVYTNSEGLSLFWKAVICAAANFSGVYIANFLFSKMFARPVRWKVEISIPNIDTPKFMEELEKNGLEYYICGYYNDWTSYAVFCPTMNDSRILRDFIPNNAKYNVVECTKSL